MKPWLLILPLAGGVLLALGFLAFQLLDRATPIEYYRLGNNDRTVIVGTTSGRNASVRVSSVSQTAKAVTITVRTFFVQLGPSTALGYVYESTVTLGAPLAGRTLMDGATGMPVPQVTCLPSFSASPCP